jgi:hypothetical protein
MSRQTRHFLLYIALLALTQCIGRVASYSVGYESFSFYLFAVLPLIIVPLLFGFRIQSWRQFTIYFLVTVIVWQMSLVMDDWVMGRLGDPLWLEDKAGTWGVEILRRCVPPIILISAGALMGQLKRTPRLR